MYTNLGVNLKIIVEGYGAASILQGSPAHIEAEVRGGAELTLRVDAR